MKISKLAVLALVTSLSAAIIAPAVYADDADDAPAAATTTKTPAQACDPKDKNCTPAPATTEGNDDTTGSDS